MRTRSERRRGFTLLEIMVTLAIVAVSVFTFLEVKEKAGNNFLTARNANWARSLARELLSELEFHELDQMNGQIDGFPGFEYEIEVEEVDLVTGAEKEEEEEEGRTSNRNSSPKASGTGNSVFTPGDALNPEGEEESVYPVRRVTLTLRYPDVSPDAKAPQTLVIQTILPPLHDEHDDDVKIPSFLGGQ